MFSSLYFCVLVYSLAPKITENPIQDIVVQDQVNANTRTGSNDQEEEILMVEVFDIIQSQHVYASSTEGSMQKLVPNDKNSGAVLKIDSNFVFSTVIARLLSIIFRNDNSNMY